MDFRYRLFDYVHSIFEARQVSEIHHQHQLGQDVDDCIEQFEVKTEPWVLLEQSNPLNMFNSKEFQTHYQ